MSRRAPRLGVIGLALTALLGCMPATATEQADSIDSLYRIFIIAGAVVFAIVWGLLTWSVIRYRNREAPDAKEAAAPRSLPRQLRGDTRLEVLWTALPIATIIALFLLTLGVLNTIQARSDSPAVRIDVTAFRWGWSFAYPGSGVTITGSGVPGPEAVVPAGQDVSFTVGSADVIHSFYVPTFLAKYDAIPGRLQSFDVTVKEPGTYGGQCAEFCGLLHSQMPFTIRAVPAGDFQAWLASQPRAASPSPPAPIVSAAP